MKNNGCIKFLRSILILFVLTSCSGKELEQTLYVHAIGIDFKDDKYVAYVQFIDFGAIAKQEGGRKDTSANWIGKAEGLSFDMATDQLYQSTQQKVSWGHVKSLVFTDNALKKEGLVEDVVDVLNRYNEIRHTIYTFGTQSDIEKIFNTNPILGISPFYSKLSDPKDIYEQYSIIEPIRLHRLLSYWYDPSRTVIFPYLGSTSKHWIENEKPYPALEINGIAAIQEGKFLSHFNREQLLGLRWIYEGTVRTPVYLYNEEKDLVASLVISNPQSEIKIEEHSNKAQFDLSVKCSASIIEMREPTSIQTLTKLAEKQIESEIKDTFLAGIDVKSDLYNLAYELYRKNPKLLKDLKKDDNFFLTESDLANVNVEVQIETSGKSKMKTSKNSPEE
jgi:Ger(x)C family germination protein